MIATLLLSQGTPLLLAGDEFGHSQQGNNNAYAQDNATGWLDWTKLNDDPDFAAQVRELVWLRRNTRLLHLPEYVHGCLETENGAIGLNWLRPDGGVMSDHDWSSARAFCVVLSETKADGEDSAAAILINAADTTVTFDLPVITDVHDWRLAFSSAASAYAGEQTATLPALTISLLLTAHD
jgi:glycogen operon protein